MPELPEVETIIRDLRNNIVNKKIVDVKVLLPRIVAPKNFKPFLKGRSFKEVNRTGKYIIIKLDNGHFLVVHLKMTGQLIYQKKDNIIAGGHSDNNDPTKVPNKWTRVIVIYNDGSKLYFNDLRTFGYMKIVGQEEVDIINTKVGVDPVENELDFRDLAKKIKARRTSIKAVLLDQKLISGLGNIYVDELLFLSGVRPLAKANKISVKKIIVILENIKPLLMSAIKSRGTTFNSYVDSQGKRGGYLAKLQVFGRGGKKCRKCGSIIKKTKVAGRGTHYCPKCQV